VRVCRDEARLVSTLERSRAAARSSDALLQCVIVCSMTCVAIFASQSLPGVPNPGVQLYCCGAGSSDPVWPGLKAHPYMHRQLNRGLKIARPVLFDTPEADRILSALQILPPDSPWHEDISSRPVHEMSAAIVRSIGADGPLGFNLDMNFVIVPADQPLVNVRVTEYPNESDPGPFPVPSNAPIENWPLARNEDTNALPSPGTTLEQFQREGTGDRHLIIVDPAHGRFHEFWQARLTETGWQASQASTFDLHTNRLRPERWTSADAAGLPILPAIVRYDEVARGDVNHALRVTVQRTRREYVYPARHFASKLTDVTLPRMGERLRLRRDFDTIAFPPHAQAVLNALKRYGMFVADNGSSWLLSIAPDRRLTGLESLSRVKGTDFEVIVPTGPDEGPRARKANR
jgi:hypothetical protein